MRNDRGDKVQLHSVEFELVVRSVSIQIRFPCKLSLALRIGKDEFESDEECKLTEGKATFTKPLKLRSNLCFNPQTKTYQEKKSTIAVYIISTTGRNIAGVVSFDASTILNGEGGQQDLPSINLERCPDRTASISYRIRSTFLQEMEGIPSDNASFTCTFPEEPREEQMASLPPRHQTRSNLPASRLLENNRSERRFELNRAPIANQRDNSAQSNQLDELSRSRISAARLNLTANRRREDNQLSNQISTLKGDLMEADRKLTRLDAEKQNYLREIAQLKSQLDSARNDRLSKNSRESELLADNERLKRKIDTLESSLETIKKSRLEMEKTLNEKNLSQRNQKTLLEELQNRNAKFEELQAENKGNKKAKDQLERGMKEKTRQLRELQEKLDDLHNSLATLQKRCDMKDNFYKEQIRKYNEKLVESEHQKQRLGIQITSLRDGGQQNTRKLSLTLKEKQKMFNEQRAKLTKRNQQLRKDIERIEAERSQERQQLQDQISNIEKLNKDLTSTEYDRISLMEEVERLKNQLISQGLYKSRYQQCLKEKNQLAQQKASLEKELSDQVRQKTETLTNLTKQNSEVNVQARSLAQQLADCQKRLKQKELRGNDSEQEIEALRKRVDILKKSDEKKSIELQQKKNSQKAMLAEMKALNDTITELEGLLGQNRERSEIQSETLRKNIKKLTQQVEQTKFKLTLANENIQKLQMQIDSYKEKESSLTDKGSKLQQRLKKFKTDIESRDINIRQLNDELATTKKSLDDTKKELSQIKTQLTQTEKKLSKTSQELSETQSMLETSQSSSTDQSTRLSKQLKQKDAELNNLYQEQTRLQIVVSQLQGQLTTVKEELKIRNAELSKERTSNDLLKKELGQVKEDKAELEGILKGKGEQLLEFKKAAGQSSADKSRLDEQLANIRQEFEKFKRGNLQTLRLLLQQISKQTLSVDRMLESLVDYETSSLQVEILKSVRAILDSHGNNSSVLSQQIASVQRQLANERTRAAEKQSELERALNLKEQEYTYFKQALLLDKHGLEEMVNVQNERLDQFNQDLIQMTAQKERYETLHKKLLLQNEQGTTQLEHLTRLLQDTEAELNTITTQLQIERRQKQQIRTRLQAERNDTEKRLQGTEKQLQSRVYQLQNQLTHHTSRGDELFGQLRATKQESDSKSTTIRGLEEKIELIESELEDRGLDIASGQKREKQLLEKVRQLEESLLIQETEVAKNRLTQKELQEKQKELESNIKVLEKEKNSNLKKIQAYEIELQSKEQVIASLKQQLLEQQEESDQLRLQLGQLQTSKSSATEQGVAKSRQIQDLSKQIEQMKERFLKQQKQITQKTEQILNLKENNDKELRKLNSNGQELQTAIQLLENSLKKQQQAKEKLQKEMEDLIAEQRKVREQLQNEISQLNEQVFHHSSEVNTLRLKQEEDTEHIQNLQADCESLQKMLAQANLQLQQKEMYINVEVSNREKQYYELKNKMEDRIGQLEQSLTQTTELAKVHQDSLNEIRKRYDDETSKLRDNLKALSDEKRSHEGHSSALIEEMEFNHQRLQADFDSLQQAAHKAEEEFVQRENDLINEIDNMRKQADERELELSNNLHQSLQQIKRLNEEISLKHEELQALGDSLNKEKEASALAAKKAQQKQKQSKKDLEELQAHLEDSLRQTSESSNSKMLQLNKQAQRKLEQFKLKAADQQHKLRSQIIELQIKLQTSQTVKQDLQRQIEEINKHQAQLYQSLANSEALSEDLKEKLQQNQRDLEEANRTIEQTQLKYEKDVIILESKHQDALSTLAKTSQDLKTLQQTKICYNPAHTYIDKIMQTVQEYHSEKTDLLTKISNLQFNIRRESDRIRQLTSEVNASLEEKTRILNKLRELNVVVLKCKSKALSKTRSQAESKIVVDEYKFLQDKINQILEYSATLLQLQKDDGNPLSHSQSSNSLHPMKGSAVLSRHSGRQDQITEPRMSKRTFK